MKHKLIPAVLVLILMTTWSCGPTYPEENNTISYVIPEFSNNVLNYNSLRQEIHCEVRVDYDSVITDMRATMQLEGFEQTTLEVALNDSGLSGDILPDDQIFSRNIVLDRIDSIEGFIRIQYDIYENGMSIKSFLDSMSLTANLPPVITEITMPDTIIRPETGTKDLFIFVSVDDPNGIYDVTNAYFQVLSNSTGQWSSDYSLYDNGELGDVNAGDGVFSTGLEISSSNSAATNYFRFRVKDTASNFSDWSLDSVVVR